MSVFINDEIVERIKDSVDIVDLISDYVDLKKQGSSYSGLCPFHNEKTPSFSVSQPKQFFKCFGCGEGGDVIEFVIKRENVDFVDAIKILADRANIQLEERQVDNTKKEKYEMYYEMNKEAARFFYGNLQNNRNVLNYLYNRNIKPNIVNRFGLGYALDSWDALLNHLEEKGYKLEDMEKNGLIVLRNDKSGYYDRFRNRVIFPIINARGKIIGFGGRVMDDSMPKYLNSKDSLVFDKGHNLYGLNLVNKFSDRENIILVEGYMDVIALNTINISYAVASLGTSLTENQANLIKRYGKNVFICYDSDNAGQKATLRAIDILTLEGIKPRVILLPDGMDPDDVIKKYGEIEFKKLVKNSLNYIDFKIQNLKKDFNLELPEDIIKFTTGVAKILATLESEIEQDVYTKKIAEETNVSIDAIKSEIKKFDFIKTNNYNKKAYIKSKKQDNFSNKNINLYNSQNLGNNIVRSGAVKAEKSIIKIMIEYKEYIDDIKEQLNREEFTCDYIKIYDIILKLHQSLEDFNLDNIKSNLEDREIEKLEGLSKLELNYDPTNIADIINDLIVTIKYNNLCNKRDGLIAKIKDLENKESLDNTERSLLINLCVELTDINLKIKTIRDD